MPLAAEVRALRDSVALTENAVRPRACFRVSGPGAFDGVEALCPRELFIRDGQMLHSLLLDETAKPIVDLYVCADGEEFLLLGEGPNAASLLSARIPAG